MRYAIVYSSRTGNTKQLAEAIQQMLTQEDCVYIGAPSDEALQADRLYVGFWTDKGSSSEEISAFLNRAGERQVFLFGTAGFGESQQYFDTVLNKAAANLNPQATLIGSFMCQGKMPMSVRNRYEQLQQEGKMPNAQAMIENFDKALAHPNAADLTALQDAVRAAQ